MKIEFIKMPYAFTDNGERLIVTEIQGSVRVGVEVIKDGDKYKVIGNANDSECVGGACPIR